MKKILLLVSAALISASLFAQKTVISDWDNVEFSQWTNNVDEEGNTGYIFKTEDPVNVGNMVGQFNRSDTTDQGQSWVYTIIENKGIDGALPIDMSVEKILALDFYSVDTFDFKVLVQDASGGWLEWKDYKYTEDDKGAWKTFVCDWSGSTSIEDAAKIELKINPDMKKGVTVYMDNWVTASSVDDLVIVSTNDMESDITSLSTMPNPAASSTTIKYGLKKAGNVSLKVYDILGNEVANLVNEYQTVGSQNVKFDVSSLNAGLYYYSLSVNGNVQTKKLQVIK